MSDTMTKTTIYLAENLPQRSSWQDKLINYAEENKVPIMDEVSMNFVETIVMLNKPVKILEIGTAIGYSALCMNAALPNAEITTIERDSKMIKQATYNINNYQKNHNIKLMPGDALEVLPQLIRREEEYDFIFIDAAKGQYKRFFDYAVKLQGSNGTIITDNVLFHGYVTGEQTENIRLKKLGMKIKDFNEWLMDNKDYQTSIIPIGDGIALSIKI